MRAGRTVLLLAVYPPAVASTRLRMTQYERAVTGAGLSVRRWSFISPGHLAAWFSGSLATKVRIVGLGLLRALRLPFLIRRADVVVVQREVIPFGPPVVELWAARRRPLVWDVDDAVWESYPGLFLARLPDVLRKTGAKFERICASATEVWAGSEVLATWCRTHNGQVLVVPTVVPLGDRVQRNGSRRVGWIGSSSTGAFVEALLPAVARVQPAPDVLVVGARVQAPPGLTVEQMAWSQAEEDRVLGEIAVGLYPIDPAHPLADGKCGLKAILYMSRGIPPVVTATRTNSVVVRDGVEGLHAASQQEWTDAVSRLLDDAELWERCSRAGHRRVEQEYSLEAWEQRVADRLVTLAGAA